MSDGTWQRQHQSSPLVRFFLPSFCFYFLCQFTLIPLFAWGRVVISGASSVISFATGSEIQNVRRPTSFPFFSFFFNIPLTRLPSNFRFLFSHLFWKIFLSILSEKIGDFHSTHEDGRVIRRA